MDFLRPWRNNTKKRSTELDTTIDQNGLAEYFTFGQNTYPAGNYGGLYPFVTYDAGYTKQETLPNDFVGYCNGAYRRNGIVFACCVARMMVFSEMRFAVQEINNGRPGDLKDNPGLRILETPWPNGTTGELLSRAIQDIDLCGNHYVVRESGPDGTRLRRLRPDWVSIILTEDPTEALKSDVLGYVYKPNMTEDTRKWEMFPVDGSNGLVAHWSPIPDPLAQYRGMSWMTPIVREVLSDEAATAYKLGFFENAATPNLMVSFDPTVTPEQFKEFMEMMNASKHGVKHAGETLYLGGGAQVTPIGSRIQEIDFGKITSISELRVAAAARVPPTIVGLTEGMRGSALNEGNFDAAKNSFADGTIRPLWRSLCASYSVLLPSIPRKSRLWYDDRDVQFLREDRQKVAILLQTDATTIARLVQDGFEPDSAVEAVIQQDWRLLKHTGLYSVQLLPPNISHPAGIPPADDPEAKTPVPAPEPTTQPDGTKQPTTPPPAQSTNYPTGSKRKPPGRPPTGAG